MLYQHSRDDHIVVIMRRDTTAAFEVHSYGAATDLTVTVNFAYSIDHGYSSGDSLNVRAASKSGGSNVYTCS